MLIHIDILQSLSGLVIRSFVPAVLRFIEPTPLHASLAIHRGHATATRCCGRAPASAP